MKISIVIQYYNRRHQLLNTLYSINNSLIKNDCEIIIVDDASNDEHQINDVPLIYPELEFKIFSFTKEEKWWSCPVITINKGISMSSGDVVILLCGECMFVGDILLDVKEKIKINNYLVYSTLALTEEQTFFLTSKLDEGKLSYEDIVNNVFHPSADIGVAGGWYQHSLHRNACYNFCTAITKDDLLDLGGFDERFGWGVSHGDDDFINRVRKKGMNVISIDNPLVYHQWHPPMQKHPVTNNLVDGELLKVTVNESGYKVKNSFIC